MKTTTPPRSANRTNLNMLDLLKSSPRHAFWLGLVLACLTALVVVPLLKTSAASAPVTSKTSTAAGPGIGGAYVSALQRLNSKTAYSLAFEPQPFTLGTCDTAGPIEIEASGGTPGPTAYANLKAAFDAINAGTHTLGISVEVCGDTTETASAVLNASGAGSASYLFILIKPAGGVARTISGSVAGPLVDLNGADNVSINGLNSGGDSLTISNTNTGATAATIRLVNDATGNTITNSTINGSSLGTPMQTGGTTAPAGATILIAGTTGTTGNDSNSITNNNIGPAGANLPVAAISSAGQATGAQANDTITITGNNIFDFYGTSGTNGVAVANSSAFNISNNQFYETASRSGLGPGNYWEAIIISTASGGNHTVNNNIIGFATNSATGMFTNSGGRFVGIDLTAVAASPVSNIQGNTINGINWTTTDGTSAPGLATFNPIIVKAGGVNIGTTSGNTIGAISGTGTAASNLFITTSASGSGIFPIYVTSSTACSIMNNKIGAIGTGGTASIGYVFTGIAVAGSGSHTISMNEVGNSTSGSVQLGIIGTTTFLSTFTGITTSSTGATNIGTIAGTGNTVQNIAMNSVATNVFTGISNTGAGTTVNINFNTIKGIVFGATAATHASTFAGIANSGAVTTALNINSNSFGIVGTGLVSYNLTATAASGALNGVNVSTGPASAAALSISNNDFRGISYASAGSGSHTYINYTHTASATDNINGNTFTNLTVNTTGSVTFIARAGSMTATGVENVNNNSIVTQFTKSGAGGTVTYFFANGSSVAGSAMSNTGNNFSNVTVTGATGIAGWANAEGSSGSGGPAKTITGNTFGAIVGGSSSITGLGMTFAQAGAVNISNNTIGNWSGTGAMTGMSVGGNSTGTQSYSNNTITNLVSNGTGGNVIAILGAPAGGTATFNGNTINTLSTTGASSTVAGISLSAAATANISGNTINALTGTGGTSPAAQGIFVSGGTTVNIFKNKIYDIAETAAISTTNGAVGGILLTGGTTTTTYNNLIGDLRAPNAALTDAVRGISVTATSTATTHNVYFNTVYLSASSVGANFGTSGVFHTISTTSTTAALNLRNNVIVNNSAAAGSGLTVAYRRSAGAANNLANYASTSNNNDFYAGTPSATNLIYSDGTSTAQTITAYKNGSFTAGTIAPRDSASVSENPPFLSTVGSNANFLHVNAATPTQLESGAAPIAGITDDFDGELRNVSTPDLGADEFTGTALDLTGPAISYTNLGIGAVAASRAFAAVTVTDATGVNGTAGTRPRVYYKKSTDTNTFNDNTSGTAGWKFVEANGSTSPFNFTIDYSKLSGGGGVAVADVIQYFVVAQDTAPAVNVGINSGTFTATPASVALTAAAFPIGGTINSFSIVAAVTGTKTVCASGCDYTTLTGAAGIFNAINTGIVTSNVEVQINGDLTTGETGAVALNTLTEEPSGSNFTVKIYPMGVARQITSTTAPTGGFIRLNAADRVTIDGSIGGTGTDRSLTITEANTGSSTAVVWLQSSGADGATANTIKNLNVVGNSNTTTLIGIGSGSSSVGIASTGSNNNNNTFQNNNVSKTQYGVFSGGASAAAKNTGNVITQNLINTASPNNVQIGGIYVIFESGISISQNNVANINASGSKPAFGISLGLRNNNTFSGFTGSEVVGATVNANIVDNIVYAGDGSAFGIGVAEVATAASAANTFTNNAVSRVRTASATPSDFSTGMLMGGGTGSTTRLYFNSVSASGVCSSSSPCFAAVLAGSNPIMDVRNNIFYNIQTSTSGKIYALGTTSTTFTNLTSNYNEFFTNSANFAVTGGLAGTDRTFATFKTTTGTDANSLNSDPLFNSTSNLQPQTGSPVVGAGLFGTGILIDILGVTRATGVPPAGPTIGAYENATDTAPPVITYSALSNTNLTTNRILTATITDGTGVAVGGNLPRIYFKKSTDGAYVSTACTMTGGTAQNGTYDCTIDYSLVGGGSAAGGDTIQYFVVTQDTLGNLAANPSAGFVGTNVNTVTTPPTTPNSYVILGSVGGSISVGTDQTITSLTNAGGLFERINNSVVTANVVINLTTDLTAETGAVALNQTSETGIGGWVINIQSSGGPRLISGSNTTALINLNGADRVTFSGLAFGPLGLTIRNTSATTGAAVLLQNDASSNTLTSVTVEGGNTSTSSAVILYGNGTTTGNDNNSISGCVIRDRTDVAGVPANAFASLNASTTALNSNNVVVNTKVMNFVNNGFATSSGATSENWTLTGNEFTQNAARAGNTFAVNTGGMIGTNVISGNSIHGFTTTGTNALVGFLVGNSLGLTIAKNRVYDFQTTAGASGVIGGIEFDGASGGAANLTVVNNMITIAPTLATAQQLIGMHDFGFGGNTFTAYHNSVYIGGTSTTQPSWAMKRGNSAPTTFTAKDNLLFNNRTGGTANNFAYGDDSANTGTFVSDYNFLAGTGATAANFLDYGTTSAGTAVSFTTWKAGPPTRDANSTAGIASTFTVSNIFYDVANGDLHLKVSAGASIIGAGITGTGVTTDFDSDPRPATGPDIGADEVVQASGGSFPSGTFYNAAGTTADLLAGDVTITNQLTLTGKLDAGANTLTINCGANIVGASSSNYILGNLKLMVCAPGAFNFPVGTENGYSPVETTVTANGGGGNDSLSVKAVQNYYGGNAETPSLNPNSLQRYWDLNKTGSITANIKWNFLPGDVVGAGLPYTIIRINGTTATSFANAVDCGTIPTASPCVDVANNFMYMTNVSTFSKWTGGPALAPTATGATISGRVTTADGRGITNARVFLSGGGLTESIMVQTGQLGIYQFDGLVIGRAYVVSVQSQRFTFAEPTRLFELNQNVTNADFVAEPAP